MKSTQKITEAMQVATLRRIKDQAEVLVFFCTDEDYERY